MKVLVTSGATREPIDSVRFITNISTGATGAAICEELLRLGHEVTALVGEGAIAPADGAVSERAKLSVERYGSFDDLKSRVSRALTVERFGLVIHLAAVSDYSVSEVMTESGEALSRDGKIDSKDGVILRLRRNSKIIAAMRGWASSGESAGATIIGFKLTDTPDASARELAVRKLAESDLDAIVHNDLAELRSGKRIFTVYDRRARVLFRAERPEQLAAEISRRYSR